MRLGGPITLEQLEAEHIRLVLKNTETAKKPRESSASTPVRSIASENILACDPRRECSDLG